MIVLQKGQSFRNNDGDGRENGTNQRFNKRQTLPLLMRFYGFVYFFAVLCKITTSNDQIIDFREHTTVNFTFRIFLCRSLQNNNVKRSNYRFS